tara:strand:+ start:1372 stop:1545 length:174 start_codon:yes stop_codon:yes gene_type:complete
MPNFIDVMDKLNDIEKRLEIMEVKMINMISAMMNEDKETTKAQLERDEYDKGNRYDT